MTYRGHIHNGVVVLDETSDLPDGTAVSVEPLAGGDVGAAAVGSPRAVLEVAGTWRADVAELDRLMGELRSDKWAEIEAERLP